MHCISRARLSLNRRIHLLYQDEEEAGQDLRERRALDEEEARQDLRERRALEDEEEAGQDMSHRYHWTRFDLSWLSAAAGNRYERSTSCSFFIRKLKPRAGKRAS